jgi:hypothetical protein
MVDRCLIVKRTDDRKDLFFCGHVM